MIPKLWTVRRSSLIIWSRSSCQLWSFHHNWKAQRCEARCIRRIWQSKKSQEGTKASSGNQEPPRTHNSDTQIPCIYIIYIYILLRILRDYIFIHLSSFITFGWMIINHTERKTSPLLYRWSCSPRRSGQGWCGCGRLRRSTEYSTKVN